MSQQFLEASEIKSLVELLSTFVTYCKRVVLDVLSNAHVNDVVKFAGKEGSFCVNQLHDISILCK
jgi:hypothetical protein